MHARLNSTDREDARKKPPYDCLEMTTFDVFLVGP